MYIIYILYNLHTMIQWLIKELEIWRRETAAGQRSPYRNFTFRYWQISGSGWVELWGLQIGRVNCAESLKNVPKPLSHYAKETFIFQHEMMIQLYSIHFHIFVVLNHQIYGTVVNCPEILSGQNLFWAPPHNLPLRQCRAANAEHDVHSSIKMDISFTLSTQERTAQHCTYESPTSVVLQHLQPTASTASHIQTDHDGFPPIAPVTSATALFTFAFKHQNATRVISGQGSSEARRSTGFHPQKWVYKDNWGFNQQKTPRISFRIEKHMGGLYYVEQLYWLY